MATLLYNLQSTPALLFAVIAFRLLVADAARLLVLPPPLRTIWSPVAVVASIILPALELEASNKHGETDHHAPEVHTEKAELETVGWSAPLAVPTIADPRQVEERTFQAARYWTDYHTSLCLVPILAA